MNITAGTLTVSIASDIKKELGQGVAAEILMRSQSFAARPASAIRLLGQTQSIQIAA